MYVECVVDKQRKECLLPFLARFSRVAVDVVKEAVGAREPQNFVPSKSFVDHITFIFNVEPAGLPPQSSFA